MQFCCCDVCSPDLVKWPFEEISREKFSVGNEEMTSELQSWPETFGDIGKVKCSSPC